MVIGEKFAWGHLRKTGGNATLMMFQLFPELIHDADPRHRDAKHRAFAEREVLVNGKLLAGNIRRLPAVILSWGNHLNYWGHKGHHVAMPSPHQMSESAVPDIWLSQMTDNGRFEIESWLRWEHLAADFIEFISMFTDVSEDNREEIFGIGRINEMHYDHEVDHWFSDGQIARLYANNPLWAAAEEAAYGRPVPAHEPPNASPERPPLAEHPVMTFGKGGGGVYRTTSA
jgi:hypothetical protein